MSELTTKIGAIPFATATVTDLIMAIHELSRAHDETRRRLGQAERTIRFMAGDIDDDSPPQSSPKELVELLKSNQGKTVILPTQPVSPTLTDRLAEALRKWLDGRDEAIYSVDYALIREYDAARSAPAAQPPAVPADVMEAAERWWRGGQAHSDAHKMAKFIIDSASGGVAASPHSVPAEVMEALKFLLDDDAGNDLDGLEFVNLSIEHGKTLARYVRDSVSPSPAASPPVCPDCNGTGKVPDSSGWCNCGCKRKVASPPAEEILKQAANQIEWYRSLCQCLECGSLCQNCNDSTDIIDALRSVASLPPPGEPGMYDAATCRALGDRIAKITKYAAIAILIRDLAGQPLPAVEGKP